MKANTTPKRIINLFQHPSKRFAAAVGTIADQRITEYHTEHGNGLTEEQVRQIVEQSGLPGGAISYGGSIEDPTAEGILVAENVGKIYNSINSFTATAESTIFVETFETATTFPAGVNLLVVNAAPAGEEPDYRFDILTGIVSSNSGLLKFETESPTIAIPEEYDPEKNLVSVSGTIEVRSSEEADSEVLFSGCADGMLKITVDDNGVMAEPLPGARKMFSDEPETVVQVKSLKVFLQC